MRRKLSNKGFSLIEIVIVLVVLTALGLGGWYVWHKHHETKTDKSKSTTSTSTSKDSTQQKASDNQQTSDPYAGWRTYHLNNGLSFRYPSNWSSPTDADSSTTVEVNSPVVGGYYFTVQAAIGAANTGLNLNFLGTASGTTVANLDVPGSSTPLYLVAQTDVDANVTGLGLATTSGSAATSFGILDNGGHGDKNFVMGANLVPAGSSASVNNPYSLQTYQSQSDYGSVVKIFKSLSYDN